MRRAVLIAIAAAALTGCGSEERATPAEVKDDPGLRVFQAQACGSCHRLSSAGSSSTLGPNLDNALRNRDRDSITQAIVSRRATASCPRTSGSG